MGRHGEKKNEGWKSGPTFPKTSMTACFCNNVKISPEEQTLGRDLLVLA